MVEALYLIIMFGCYILTLSSQTFPIAGYTLTPGQSISDGQTLVSQGGKFELGFFRPSASSKNRYLGIWYKTISPQTVIWVANRESPVLDTSGVVRVTTGNIVIVNVTGLLIWSSNSSQVVENSTAVFLESGNLVLRDASDGDPDSYLWQSFDYPSDTWIPGMRLGSNLKTGMNRYLSSWKSFDDPSHGDMTYGVEMSGYPEIFMRKGSTKYYRAGSWNGVQNTGAPDLNNNSIFTYDAVQNADEFSFSIQLVNQSVILRMTLVQTSTEGRLERSVWVDNSKNWDILQSIPRDSCDEYARCGIYSTCDTTNVVICQCLKGFKPKSPQNWSSTDWSQGCERDVFLNCSKGEGFKKYAGLKLPDTTNSWYNLSMTLEECRVMCLNNCSCMAYANARIAVGGSGCILWFKDLIDIKQFSRGGQDLYIRMAASELVGIKDSEANAKTRKSVTTIVSVSSVVAIIVVGFAVWYHVWKKRGSKGVSERDGFELPLYDLSTVTSATNNFSADNKLGEGGFGPVFKGKLGEQEIAVKRLSKDSTQGVDAFKNEVILISKLQHRNLVKLLGCCIQGEEKMLVYEYMPNNSLDLSIFDETKRILLNWQKRFQIIQGVAAGLLYLHHDSRLRIIHRDLKASNILLDSKMVPKISDFGMARIFGGDQIEAKTKRVVGTYGYMSPEYLIDGHFSIKSDVFSFGVLVLEIISGKKNWGFHHPDHELNLLGHAWKLYCEDRSSEFVDKYMGNSSLDQDALRCIHIGLLCVQKEVEQRPTMSSVVTMLSSEIAVLPRPQRPGFYMERTLITGDSSHSSTLPGNSNDDTITLVEGR